MTLYCPFCVGGADYTEVVENFEFNFTTHHHCIDVSLSDDDLDEETEIFSVNLNLVGEEVAKEVKVVILDNGKIAK